MSNLQRPAVGRLSTLTGTAKSPWTELIGLLIGVLSFGLAALSVALWLGESSNERRVYELESENRLLQAQQLKVPDRNEIPF